MNRRFFLFLTSALGWLGWRPSTALTLLAADANADQATPAALARASFAAFQRQDIPKFVTYFHPDALAQFKEFALDVFGPELAADRQIDEIRALFAPFATRAEVEAAGQAELMTAFLKNNLAKLEGIEAILAEAELQILGEIAEGPDKVHIITRTVWPRPSPVTCQKSQGRWYHHLNDDQLRLIQAMRQKKHFSAKDPAAIQQKIRIESVDVLGHVPDGASAAQVLCRVQAKIEDFPLSVFACYPVRQGEPAWDLLDGDEAKLVEALRAKWGG